MNTKDIQNAVYDILKEVIDPELGINIIDLGLVYEINPMPENSIQVIITLTTPGCPMGDTIIEDIKQSILKSFQGFTINVEVTFEPMWTSSLISPQGKLFLGMA
jgi:metal-sulfur cluster biosynthetic enzyme